MTYIGEDNSRKTIAKAIAEMKCHTEQTMKLE